MKQQLYPKELFESTVSKLNTAGFVINLAIPAALLLAGFYLRSHAVQPPDLGDATTSTLLYTLIGVSVIEVVVAFFLKRRLYANLGKYFTDPDNLKEQAGLVMKMTIIIHVVSATPVLYGLLYYFLGGGMEGYLIMIILNLIGYQLCRVRKSDVANLEDFINAS